MEVLKAIEGHELSPTEEGRGERASLFNAGSRLASLYLLASYHLTNVISHQARLIHLVPQAANHPTAPGSAHRPTQDVSATNAPANPAYPGSYGLPGRSRAFAACSDQPAAEPRSQCWGAGSHAGGS
jgi:hypothetical protein